MSPIIGRQAVDIYADAVDMLVSNLSTEDVVRPAVLDVLQRLICYPPEGESVSQHSTQPIYDSHLIY